MKQRETEKFEKILTAAAALFSRQGYQKTAIDEIVAEAGVSKGLFYHYFRDKQELYLTLYEAYTSILSEKVNERVDLSETDLCRRLKQISHLKIDVITQMPHLWSFLYSAYYEQHSDVAPLIQDRNLEMLRESHNTSASNIDWSRLRPGMSPERAIEMIAWIADGFISKVTRNGLPADSEVYMEFDYCLDCLITGIYRDKEGQDAISE